MFATTNPGGAPTPDGVPSSGSVPSSGGIPSPGSVLSQDSQNSASSEPRIVLASQSPSRASILRAGGIDPVLVPARVDEQAIWDGLPDASPAEVVAALARAKAHAVAHERAADFSGDIILGGDSMLLLDGQLQGKPHTREATVERWRAQAGRTAHLLTGHCALFGKAEFVETATTAVHFATAATSDIEAYAATGEPLECAGAFTLEALGGWFIDGIEGDPSSVIGLSLPVVRRALYSFGLRVADFWDRH